MAARRRCHGSAVQGNVADIWGCGGERCDLLVAARVAVEDGELWRAFAARLMPRRPVQAKLGRPALIEIVGNFYTISRAGREGGSRVFKNRNSIPWHDRCSRLARHGFDVGTTPTNSSGG